MHLNFKFISIHICIFFLCSGCAGTNGYFADRGRDAADIFTLTAELGIGAKARVGTLTTGLLLDKGIGGLRGGQLVITGTERQKGLPEDLDLYFFCTGTEWFNSCRETGFKRGKDFGTGFGFLFWSMPIHKAPFYYTEIEAVIALGPGMRVGFNPGELIDFILGWGGIDIFQDDLNLPENKIYIDLRRPMITKHTCYPEIDPKIPDSRFSDNHDGTVTDNQTRLMWKKCSEGQDGIDCNEGEAKLFKYYSAMATADEANKEAFAGYSDWRVPSLNELESIIEKQCLCPSINLRIFPNSPVKSVWSSTRSEFKDYEILTLHFFKGDNSKDDRTNQSPSSCVRLVRSAR